MPKIERAAVIGAGTMGAGIASHLANAGVEVVLLDVVPDGAQDRNVIAQRAIQRQLESSPPAFMHHDFAARIRPGNIEDHLDWLAGADWIAEAVVERLDVKHALYRQIAAKRKPGAMVSSNTSTIPLALLTEGMDAAMRRDFCITHFFNPVRYMRLLEIVAGPDTRAEVIEALTHFCDVALGKGVVRCRDTPGFLGNRVGVFALQVGLVEAARFGLNVEEADAIMGRPMGIPKTGVFGLYDLIGLDLMMDVAKSLAATLPPADAFHDVAAGIPLVAELVARGHTGNKGKGGFYRLVAGGGGRVREAIDLASGVYRAAVRPALAAAQAGEQRGLRALVEHDDPPGRFARRVLARVLGYAASLVPEVADDPVPIDEAMRLGFSWSHGPFEMIDALGVPWFRECLRAEGLPVPALLETAGSGSMYRVESGRLDHIDAGGGYAPVRHAPGVIRLREVARTRARVDGNEAASLWDVGEWVACLEFHTKANALVPASMQMLARALEVVARDYRALVLHTDAPHFSVGVNLEWVRDAAARSDWRALDGMLAAFQSTCVALKHAPFPVVAAPAGLALGGGFEVVLHANAVQAHANTTLGLVETLVGLIPGGGGCKEALVRWQGEQPTLQTAAQAARRVFEQIALGKTAASPVEAARYRYFLDGRDASSMNRDRLLADARTKALSMAQRYQPPPSPGFIALGAGVAEALDAFVVELMEQGIATAHDRVVGHELARVLTGAGHSAGAPLAEADVLALERDAFIRLCETEATRARIDHMLATGRPLRN